MNLSNTTPINDYQKWFLIALLLFLILPVPITFFPDSIRLIFAISYTLLVLCGIRSLTEKRRHLVASLILGLISFLFIWGSFISTNTTGLQWGNTLSLLAFFLYLAYLLFRKIALYKDISLNVIFASISGYLVIGIIGGLFFQLLELAIPHSFKGLTLDDGFYDLHYFSFVTLTTLGFGDITPITAAAKAITILLSIAGQLYLTILIAMLVGKYLSRP